MIFESDKLKVKVVQIYDDIPLSYYGLTHHIWCQSPATIDMAWGGIEKGWNEIAKSGIGEPGQSPSKDVQKKALDAAVMDANKHLQVISDETILFESYGMFTITFNGCEKFYTWNGWTLPEEMVIQNEKKSQCPKDIKCPWENFRGENQITYSEIKTDVASKTVSFRAHSKAFKEGDLLVRSEDGGFNWVATKWKRK